MPCIGKIYEKDDGAKQMLIELFKLVCLKPLHEPVNVHEYK